jgi:hypothetical protein
MSKGLKKNEVIQPWITVISWLACGFALIVVVTHHQDVNTWILLSFLVLNQILIFAKQ